MKRFAFLSITAICLLVARAANINNGYTATSSVATNAQAYVQFDSPAMLVDIVNSSTNQIQFALNCPDASVWTNLYTNSICGLVLSGETKRIQIQNYPIKSVRLKGAQGTNNIVYITAF